MNNNCVCSLDLCVLRNNKRNGRETKLLDEDQTTFPKNVFNSFKKQSWKLFPGPHLIFKHTLHSLVLLLLNCSLRITFTLFPS